VSLGKKDIAINITSKALFPSKLSQIFLENFLSLIKKNKTNNIKFTNFGVFYIKNSPERVGRNPKTNEEFKISRRKKLSFKASNKVKSKLN
jgi:integration host factor subunit alpha